MKNKKPKIGIIGLKGLPAFGGAATVGENIIEQLKDKYDFTVYAIKSHTHLKTGNYKGICHQIVFKDIRLKKLNSLMYYFRSAIHALFCNYNIIHLHHRDAAFTLPFLKLRYNVVLTTHGMVLTDKWLKYKWFFDFTDRLFLNLTDIITTVSRKDERIVHALLPEKTKKIIHIPNGINSLVVNIPKEDKITFAAGRIVTSKGGHDLLEALSHAKINIETQIIGDTGQMKAYKKQLFDSAKQLPNVKFLGLIKDKSKLFEMIASSRIFVYPSLIESMSMTLLEVASLGVPIICCRIRENEDVFNDDEVLFYTPGSSADLADKIIWALDNPEAMSTKASNALSKLTNKFLWKDICLNYASVYDKLL